MGGLWHFETVYVTGWSKTALQRDKHYPHFTDEDTEEREISYSKSILNKIYALYDLLLQKSK